MSAKKVHAEEPVDENAVEPSEGDYQAPDPESVERGGGAMLTVEEPKKSVVVPKAEVTHDTLVASIRFLVARMSNSEQENFFNMFPAMRPE